MAITGNGNSGVDGPGVLSWTLHRATVLVSRTGTVSGVVAFLSFQMVVLH